MKRVLIRVGYGLAPVVVFGAVALSTGSGHHRLLVLVLAVLSGLVLGFSADDAEGEGRWSLRSAAPSESHEVPVAHE